jgi:hypothetical protein
MAQWPTSVSTDAQLYIAANDKSTALTVAATNSDTTINVGSTTGFPATGLLSIDNEIIAYTGLTPTTFTGLTRGQDGTSAASHLLGASVDHNVVAAHHNVLKDEIIALETSLNLTASRAVVTDSNGRVATSSTTSTELGALNAKTANRALQTDGSGLVSTSSVTSTELGYVSGVTSAIQTQIGTKANDADVVKLTGNQTVAGTKTFTSSLQPQAGIFASDSLSGLTLAIETRNTSNTASSDAVLRATAGGTSGGDSYVRLGIIGATDWVAGVDNSDSDSFKISNNATPGTNDHLIIGTSGAVAIRGTGTNDSATAGFVGEYVSSNITTNTNFPSSGVYGDLTSISLTAGNWILGFNCDVNNASGVTVTDFEFGMSSNSGNSSTGLTLNDNYQAVSTDLPTGDREQMTISGFRVSLSSTTTYYLKYSAGYTGGTAPFARGKIYALRVR